MKYLPRFFVRCSMAVLVPVAANAAGTYYTGNYQSPQQRYSNSSAYSSTRGYSSYSNANPNARYNAGGNWSNQQSNQQRTQQNQSRTQGTTAANKSAAGNGFFVDAGLSYETAKWQMEMKNAGSILRYDDVNWYVFDINGGYNFNAGNLPMQVVAGFKYGMQGADSYMIDDDITNGGYKVRDLFDDVEDNKIVAQQLGTAMSVGTSSGGSMLGFNLGLGLTDFFKVGNVKMTPSIGYRYLKYKLETKDNHGLSVEFVNNQYVDNNGELRYVPMLILNDGNAVYNMYLNKGVVPPLYDGSSDQLQIPSGENWTAINTQRTLYFAQPGTSHSYEVEWAGPYLAMDMDYAINQNNAVNGRVELGLPAYTATGDQPYRFDWDHPKSVEDKGGFGDAFHLGLGANWTTAITDSVSLSLGLTYDYYTLSGADATTYYNASFWNAKYDALLEQWKGDETAMLNPDTGDGDAIFVNELRSAGWKIEDSGEIESFYKSLGIRVGIRAIF